MVRKYLKHLYQKTKLGYWLIYPFKNIYNFYQIHILSEKTYINRRFKRSLGYKLNLNNPNTYNEKIQWFQQNCRTPLHTICADKYAVREYVADKIGKEHLIPLILQTTDVSDIVPEKLPDYPFIIKPNHWSRANIIVKDKTIVDWNRIQRTLNKLLRSNFYYRGREWQYKEIKPCILVEKLLLDKEESPLEYKYHCTNGEISFFSIINKRHTNPKMNNYDSEWNNIPWGNQFDFNPTVNKLKILGELESVVKKLAHDFRFVRVDFYNIGSNNYFGELTFSPSAGYIDFNDLKWEKVFGDLLRI